MLEVVHPAFRDHGVIRTVEPRRDRILARGDVVPAGGGRAVRVFHRRPDRHVLVAHVGLDVAGLWGGIGLRRRSRARFPDRRTGVRRLGRGREDTDADHGDHGHERRHDDRDAVRLDERALDPWPCPDAPTDARGPDGTHGWSRSGWLRCCRAVGVGGAAARGRGGAPGRLAGHALTPAGFLAHRWIASVRSMGSQDRDRIPAATVAAPGKGTVHRRCAWPTAFTLRTGRSGRPAEASRGTAAG